MHKCRFQEIIFIFIRKVSSKFTVLALPLLAHQIIFLFLNSTRNSKSNLDDDTIETVLGVLYLARPTWRLSRRNFDAGEDDFVFLRIHHS